MKGKKVIINVLVVVVGALISLTGFITPRINADEVYSVERSWENLQELSRQPRNVGSNHHAEAQKWIRQKWEESGIYVQTLPSYSADYSGKTVKLNNIYADLELAEGSSVLFIAHYDSVEGSPGAGDNGMSVASLVEAVAAFPRSEDYNTNIKVLLTDGEELGLLGAEAFIREHQDLLKDVVAVINVEGYGNGPVMLIENNLSSLYVDAVNHSVGYSAIAAMSGMTGIGLDTHLFTQAGYSCMTVATVLGAENYHSPRDSFANASYASQAHNLDTVFSLMRYVATAEEETLQKYTERKEDILFNLLYGVKIYYSYWAGVVLAGLALVLAVLYIIRQHKIRWRKVPFTLAGIFVIPVLYYAAVQVLMSIFSRLTWNKWIQIPLYSSDVVRVYIILILLVLPLILLLTEKMIRKAGMETYTAVLFLLLGGLGMAAACLFSGAAYTFYLTLLLLVCAKLSGIAVLEYISQMISVILIFPLLVLALTTAGAQFAAIGIICLLLYGKKQ